MNPSESSVRRRGNAVVAVLLLLVVVALLLGGNYVRNLQTEKQQEKQSRPYSKYKVADLQVLAEGYRMEIETVDRKANRVATRNLHHFQDQVLEFERVQKAARKERDKAMGVAQLRRDLEAIEAELAKREDLTQGAKVHLSRMFRL